MMLLFVLLLTMNIIMFQLSLVRSIYVTNSFSLKCEEWRLCFGRGGGRGKAEFMEVSG